MKDIAILGAGGFAREVWWLIEEINTERPEWNVIGYIDDNAALRGTSLCDVPVLGDFSWLEAQRYRPHVISGVGSNSARRTFASRAAALELPFATLIHPTARRSRFVEIGSGTVICAGNILTTQVRMGSHVNLNLNCTIGHDVVIEDFCNLSPGINVSGYVHLEQGVDIGTNAALLPGKRVGRGSVIGAGAVVSSDIPPFSVAVGVPAKVIRQLPHEGEPAS